MIEPTFSRAFLTRLHQDWGAKQEGNFDHYRFPRAVVDSPTQRSLYGARVRSLLRAARTLVHSANLQWIYDRLVDEPSRELLVRLLAFYALGSRHVRLPLNAPRFWNEARAIERDLLRTKGTYRVSGAGMLDDFDLAPSGIPVRLRGHLLNVLNAFCLQQYRFEREGVVIEVEPGDTVIDAGGCWGDTALYFAHRTGPKGSVWSYEFEAENLKVFAHNLQLNPNLAKCIRIVQHPVWSTAGIPLEVIGSGPNARLAPAKAGRSTVTTDAVDSLVAREALGRVDFLKMDIEGAEVDALKGAEATIRRYRPKLAICVYHRMKHLWEVPRWLDELGLGYRFFLDHFTIHGEETVLFAAAPRP